MTHKTQPTAHAEITAPISADLRRIEDAGTKSAPITLMTEDRACTWAWDQVREDVGTKGWTTGDSCTFYGFFLWGWNYRGQYETQRSAAPPAPAAVAMPAPLAAGMKAAADLVQEQADLYIAEHAETDPNTGAVIWHHRDYGFDWHNGLEELAQKLRARAALAAAPAQAYSIDADPQGIRAYVADAITGALACGAQGTGTPPPDHWLTPFWRQARFGQIQYNALRDATDALLNAPGAAQEHATQLAGQGQDKP